MPSALWEIRDRDQHLRGRLPLLAAHADEVFERGPILGRGGMGTVYQARDLRLDRPVALKVLHKASPRARARFRRELAVMARLEHPAIPPIYEAGISAGGEAFLAMRLISGRTLEAALEAGLNKRDALEALLRVAEAIAYAHSRGVVHRDLKPANIMIGAFGEVMVLDWGIVRDLSEDEARQAASLEDSLDPAGRLTLDGAILGTPGYMPPEQARRSRDVDGRADVFALGALLTEVLTKRLPAPGDSGRARLAATLDGQIIPPTHAEEPDPTLRAIAARAIAPSRARRTPDAATFVAELRAVLADESPPGGEPLLRHAARRLRRAPAPIIGGLAILMVLALTAAALLRLHNNRQAEAMARSRRRIAERARDDFDAIGQSIQQARKVLDDARDAVRRGAPRDQVRALVRQALTRARRGLPIALLAARIHAEGEDEEEARRVLERAIRDHPPGLEARYALHQLELARYPGADFRMTDALAGLVAAAKQRRITNEFTLFSEGLQALQDSRYDLAEARADAMLALAPRLAVAYELKGAARLGARDAEGGLAALDRALELDPRLITGRLRRSRARALNGRFADALEDCEILCDRLPTFVPAITQRALILERLGQTNAALAVLEEALERLPTNAKLRTRRAALLRGFGRYREAVRELETAARERPEDPDVFAARGDALMRLGDLRRALADFNKVLEITPRRPDILKSRAYVLGQLGLRKEAIAGYTELLEVQPDDANAYYSRGYQHSVAGDYKNAIADYSAALKIRPRYAIAMANRGLCFEILGQHEKALQDFDGALAIDPDYALGYDHRGKLRLARGDARGALDDFKAATRLNPKDIIAVLHRGEAYDRLGLLREAAADYRAYLQRAGPSDTARRIRQRLAAIEARE